MWIQDGHRTDMPRGRWRPRQFSLRALFAFVTLVAVLVGPRSYYGRRDSQALSLAAAIGVSPAYDTEKLQRPGFLHVWLGDKHLSAMRGLVSVTPAATDQSIGRLVDFDTIKPVLEVNANDSGLTVAGIEALAALKHLKGISLANTSITDEAIRALASSAHLESLSLDHTQITDQSLDYIAPLLQLKSLSITFTQVTNDGLKRLSALPNLRELRLTGTNVTDEGIFLIWAKNPKLEIYIEMVSQRPGRADVPQTKWPSDKFASYKEIILSYPCITSAALAYLSGAERLTTLRLANSRVDDTGMARVSAVRSLKYLDLANTQIGDDGLRHIRGLRELSFLDLGGTKVTDHGLPFLVDIADLRRLSLRSSKVTDAGMVHLGGSSVLTELDLSDTRIGDGGVASLCSLNSLETLDVSRTMITDAVFASLVRMPTLKVLRMNDTAITDSALKGVNGSLSALVELSLYRTQVSAEGAAAIMQTRPGCRVYHGDPPSPGSGSRASGTGMRIFP